MKFQPKSVSLLNLCSFYYTVLPTNSHTVDGLENENVFAELQVSSQTGWQNQQHCKNLETKIERISVLLLNKHSKNISKNNVTKLYNDTVYPKSGISKDWRER